MRTEYYLENRSFTGDTEHQKFYRIIVDGTETHFTWGAIGCHKPGKEDKAHASQSEAFAYAEAKLKSKRSGRNPYHLITEKQGSDVPSMSASRTAPGHRPIVNVQHEERPQESGRRFGFEVETHSNLDPKKIAQQLADRKLKINYRAGDYFHSDGKSWDVKRDGSCGYEFASPILRGEAGIFDIKLALEKIRAVCETAVNAACGIHVTIDVADHSKADLIRLCLGYLKAQEHFYARCNKTRQKNEYCLRNPVKLLANMPKVLACKDGADAWRTVYANITDNSRGSRYHGLNLTNVNGTAPRMELRMLESTLDARKVGAWVRMCVGFVDGMKASNVRFTTGEVFSEDTFASIVEGTWKPRVVPVAA